MSYKNGLVFDTSVEASAYQIYCKETFSFIQTKSCKIKKTDIFYSE
jgi:hypothetical protein